MDKITLERKYLNIVDGKKSPREIREELQKEAVLNGWFTETLPGEIKNALMRLWDRGIVNVTGDHVVVLVKENK